MAEQDLLPVDRVQSNEAHQCYLLRALLFLLCYSTAIFILIVKINETISSKLLRKI